MINLQVGDVWRHSTILDEFEITSLNPFRYTWANRKHEGTWNLIEVMDRIERGRLVLVSSKSTNFITLYEKLSN